MMRLIKRPTLWLLGALALFAFGTVQGFADPVRFTANTSGAFGAGPTGGVISGGGSTISVDRTSITFSSRPGELTVSLDPGQSSNVTLGVFNSTSTAGSNFTGATFTLTVTFTLPGDTSPNPATYTATLTGTVQPGSSGAEVVWANRTLTFTSATAGTFTLMLEEKTPINAPSSPDASRIRGTITYVAGAAPIPEPVTLLTLGSGLAGLAALTRRRKKSN